MKHGSFNTAGSIRSAPGREGEGSLRTYTIPVPPRRCDHLRYRISGTGDVKIYSIARTVETGSDVNKKSR